MIGPFALLFFMLFAKNYDNSLNLFETIMQKIADFLPGTVYNNYIIIRSLHHHRTPRPHLSHTCTAFAR